MSIPLDPKRTQIALGRAVMAELAARRMEKSAAAERAKIDTLCRTWGFTPAEVVAELDARGTKA